MKSKFAHGVEKDSFSGGIYQDINTQRDTCENCSRNIGQSLAKNTNLVSK